MVVAGASPATPPGEPTPAAADAAPHACLPPQTAPARSRGQMVADAGRLLSGGEHARELARGGAALRDAAHAPAGGGAPPRARRGRLLWPADRRTVRVPD